MTPRTIDWQTVRAKLRMIRERLNTLSSLGAVEPSWWDGREVEALAVERILILVVDLAVDINNHVCAVDLGRVADDYQDTFPLVAKTGMITEELAKSLAPSTGTRNILVHQYIEVDHDRVALAARLAVEQYGEYVRQVAAWVQTRIHG